MYKDSPGALIIVNAWEDTGGKRREMGQSVSIPQLSLHKPGKRYHEVILTEKKDSTQQNGIHHIMDDFIWLVDFVFRYSKENVDNATPAFQELIKSVVTWL